MGLQVGFALQRRRHAGSWMTYNLCSHTLLKLPCKCESLEQCVLCTQCSAAPEPQQGSASHPDPEVLTKQRTQPAIRMLTAHLEARRC